MLRSKKKGHNKISPKQKNKSSPKRKIQAKPKAIDTKDPWGDKRKAQRILKPRKERSIQKETTAKYKEARILRNNQ